MVNGNIDSGVLSRWSNRRLEHGGWMWWYKRSGVSGRQRRVGDWSWRPLLSPDNGEVKEANENRLLDLSCPYWRNDYEGIDFNKHLKCPVGWTGGPHRRRWFFSGLWGAFQLWVSYWRQLCQEVKGRKRREQVGMMGGEACIGTWREGSDLGVFLLLNFNKNVSPSKPNLPFQTNPEEAATTQHVRDLGKNMTTLRNSFWVTWNLNLHTLTSVGSVCLYSFDRMTMLTVNTSLLLQRSLTQVKEPSPPDDDRIKSSHKW